MQIDIIQFHLPNGRQTQETTEIDDEYEDKYNLMRELGLRLTAEILRNGMVSCCIEIPGTADFDCSVTQNGPQVQAGIEKMLGRLTRKDYEEFVSRMEE